MNETDFSKHRTESFNAVFQSLVHELTRAAPKAETLLWVKSSPLLQSVRFSWKVEASSRDTEVSDKEREYFSEVAETLHIGIPVTYTEDDEAFPFTRQSGALDAVIIVKLLARIILSVFVPAKKAEQEKEKILEEIDSYQKTAEYLYNSYCSTELQNIESLIASGAALENAPKKEINALYHVAQALTEIESLPKLLGSIAKKIQEALPAGRVLIYLLDQENEEIQFFVKSGKMNLGISAIPYKELMQGLTGWVIKNKKPAFSAKNTDDNRESTLVKNRREEAEAGSIIVVPIIYHGNVLGTITAINHFSSPDFIQEDIDLLMSIARNTAAAVANSMILKEKDHTLKANRALYKTSKALNSTSSAHDCLQTAMNNLVDALFANRVVLFLLEEGKITGFYPAGPGSENVVPISYEELNEGLSGWVMRQNKPAVSKKDEIDPRESIRVQRRRASTSSGSIIVVPIRVNGKPKGTITAINLPEEPDFTKEDVHVLMGISNQVASFLERRRLITNYQKQISNISSLYQVSSAVMEIEDYKKLLKTIADTVAKALPSRWVAVIPADVENRIMGDVIISGEHPQVDVIEEYAEFDEGLSGWVIRNKKPAISPKDTPDPREPKRVRERRERNNCGAILVVPLMHQGEILGTMTAVNFIQDQNFDQDDADLMMSMAAPVASALQNSTLLLQYQNQIKERKIAAKKLEQALEEKEILLKEIHHRVKNNLQTISSLLHLQQNYINDEDSLKVFKDSQSSIRSMSLVHEKLYHSENIAELDFKEYLDQLVSSLFGSYNIRNQNIRYEIQATRSKIGIDQAITLGLIANEIISNSLKYAFPENRDGLISIELHRSEKDGCCLKIEDNGVGFPEDYDPKQTKTLGLVLIHSLVKQLGGSLDIHHNGGIRYTIEFSCNNK